MLSTAAGTVLFGAVGAVAAVPAILAPLTRAQGATLRRDVHGLSDRVARIEGTLTGPWRPPGGRPSAISRTRSKNGCVVLAIDGGPLAGTDDHDPTIHIASPVRTASANFLVLAGAAAQCNATFPARFDSRPLIPSP